MNTTTDVPAVMFLPLIEVPGTGLVAVGPECETESQACDQAQYLAAAGCGRYGGAVPVISTTWLDCDNVKGGA